MDELSKLYLEHECISYKSVTGTGKSQIGFGQVPLEQATRYAAEDADITLRLWQIMKPRLSAEGGTKVYEMVDRPVLTHLAHMEREGIKVDREKLAGLSAEFAGIMEMREKEIHAIAGEPFTIGSPKQLGEILFGKLGLKGGKKGKSGQYSTDVTVLERLAQDGHEIARKVLDWRQMAKLKSTYTDALQDDINPKTGRVHTSYSLVGAQTGRLSSNDPNLQNIPIRTEMGRQIRYAFVAEPGNVILAADYSQIELRLAAHMADVDTLRQAFADGEDIHNRTAQELFGEVNRDTRGRAKTINFAILYGISRWGLAGRLEVSSDEAQDMISTYFERFPGINRYISDTMQSTKERLYTETLFGRKTHFPRINAKNQTELQVHDELVFELPESDVEAASAIIRNVMANAAQPAVTLTVPLEIDIGTGPSWGDAH
jgi:DNA polymerase-1